MSSLIHEPSSQCNMRSSSCPILVLASSFFNLVLKYFCPSNTTSDAKLLSNCPARTREGGWSPLSLTVKAKALLVAGSFALAPWVYCSWRGGWSPLFSGFKVGMGPAV